MSESTRTYLPAAGYDWSLPFYDPIVKLLGGDKARMVLLAKEWHEQLAAFHEVGLHVVGAWWYDPQRDFTVIVYSASSEFKNRAGLVKDNGPAIATSLRQTMMRTKLQYAGGSGK